MTAVALSLSPAQAVEFRALMKAALDDDDADDATLALHEVAREVLAQLDRPAPPVVGVSCCYAGCKRRPNFSVWLAFKREHGGERAVPLCAEHAAFLTLNDAFVPAATFAGRDLADTGPWSDWAASPMPRSAPEPAAARLPLFDVAPGGAR